METQTPVQVWLSEIQSALDREKGFRKTGKRVTRLYEAGASSEAEAAQTPFNILYSNTDTLLPALYNAVPRPVVQRRYKDESPLGKEAAKVGQRLLEFQLDASDSEYESFDDLMQLSVLQALVPGRGMLHFKYEASFEKETSLDPSDTIGHDAEEFDEIEAAETATGDPASPHQFESVSGENVVAEGCPWDYFIHGYARTWKEVPWAAFRYDMTKEELVKNFGEVAQSIELEVDDDSQASYSGENKRRLPSVEVWKIWDRGSKKVLFVSQCYRDGFLKEVDDPLGLSGFFPFPEPLTFFPKLSSITPTALYVQYESQAEELNTVTTRIKSLTKAMKIRGGYDATIQEIERILTSEDNTLIPLENVAALGDQRGIDKAVFFIPIEKYFPVLQQLLAQRQSIKQVIYEITGVSDILRGASVASETATAQNIKNQWGTLRLKRMQKRVAKYACDCLRLMLEISVKHFSVETIRQMTGLPYPTRAEQAQAQAAMQELQLSGAMSGQPVQVPPELQKVLGTPTWEDILEVLRNDLQRAYKIDIQTNSTVDAEATEDKANIAEFMNALAQFFNAIAPAVQAGALPFEAAKTLLLAIVRRFRFGPEVEDELLKMVPPQAPGGDGGAAEAAKLELESKKQELQLKSQAMQQELAFKTSEHEFRMKELQQKSALAEAQFALEMKTVQLRAAAPAAPAQPSAPGKSARVMKS